MNAIRQRSDRAGGARIAGTGHYQPSRVVPNEEIAHLVDTTDAWVRQRVGIRTRRFADTESVAEMGAEAARAALLDSGCDPATIDLVIVATTTATDRSPSTAGRVIEELGLRGAAGFDVNSACSGFVHALETAKQLLSGGSARAALVIGAERMTDVTDWSDRSTCILVGDGAGAVVVEAASAGIGPVVWGTAPGMTDAVRIEAPELAFAQDGRRVLRWAITEAAQHARRALDLAGLTPADVEAFIPHQANLRIIEPLVEQLGSSTPSPPWTSLNPATPRPRACPSPCPNCAHSIRCAPARPCCSSASAAASPTRR